MLLWTSVFSVVAHQDSPKASPRAIFKLKELARTTEAIVLMNIMNERWRKLKANMRQCVPFGANMGQHCSLSAVQRRKAFWNSHDGLNLTCLDQCHGVCSHGTSSY